MNRAILSKYLLVQSQQKKHQKKVWNMFAVNNRTPEGRLWRRFGVFIVNFEQISHLFLVFPLLNLNK